MVDPVQFRTAHGRANQSHKLSNLKQFKAKKCRKKDMQIARSRSLDGDDDEDDKGGPGEVLVPDLSR